MHEIRHLLLRGFPQVMDITLPDYSDCCLRRPRSGGSCALSSINIVSPGCHSLTIGSAAVPQGTSRYRTHLSHDMAFTVGDGDIGILHQAGNFHITREVGLDRSPSAMYSANPLSVNTYTRSFTVSHSTE